VPGSRRRFCEERDFRIERRNRMSTTAVEDPRETVPPRAFRAVVLTLLALLIPQFVLGMITNLYLPFPGKLNAGKAWGFALSQPVIYAHIALGSLIVILAVIAIVVGIVSRRRLAVVTSMLGLLLVSLAWFSGEEFLVQGQSNLPSVSMAFSFLAALIVYAVGYHLTGRRSHVR
jgi:hypothetical protein